MTNTAADERTPLATELRARLLQAPAPLSATAAGSRRRPAPPSQAAVSRAIGKQLAARGSVNELPKCGAHNQHKSPIRVPRDKPSGLNGARWKLAMRVPASQPPALGDNKRCKGKSRVVFKYTDEEVERACRRIYMPGGIDGCGGASGFEPPRPPPTPSRMLGDPWH